MDGLEDDPFLLGSRHFFVSVPQKQFREGEWLEWFAGDCEFINL